MTLYTKQETAAQFKVSTWPDPKEVINAELARMGRT